MVTNYILATYAKYRIRVFLNFGCSSLKLGGYPSDLKRSLQDLMKSASQASADRSSLWLHKILQHICVCIQCSVLFTLANDWMIAPFGTFSPDWSLAPRLIILYFSTLNSTCYIHTISMRIKPLQEKKPLLLYTYYYYEKNTLITHMHMHTHTLVNGSAFRCNIAWKLYSYYYFKFICKSVISELFNLETTLEFNRVSKDCTHERWGNVLISYMESRINISRVAGTLMIVGLDCICYYMRICHSRSLSTELMCTGNVHKKAPYTWWESLGRKNPSIVLKLYI